MVNLNFIGKVKNSVNELVDDNWGSIESEIVLNHEYANGLRNLDSFSHAIIIFYMDKSDFDISKDLVRRPRGRSDLPEYGIFAQRAKHRPNPIGITTVKIIKVQNNILTVKGLDAINETPIIDIKPYFKVFDNIENYKQANWVDDIMKDYF
ncbi:MAG: tRNA (N6-threonylcarbamoyladenosine(37)-N6)-methyltransferase TrmO [Candidatus Sericytochromatia bacterium]